MPDNSLAWMRNDEADERMAELHRRFCARRFDPRVSRFVRLQDRDGKWRSVRMPSGEAVEKYLADVERGYIWEGPSNRANADRIREHIAASRVVASDAGALLRWVVR